MGRDRQRATQLRRVVGRRQRNVRPASGSGTRRRAQPACAVSIPRRAPRLRLRFPGHRHRPVGDDPRGDPAPDTCKRSIDAGGVLGRDPRRLARRRGPRRRHRNACSRRAGLLCGVGRPASWRSARPTTRCNAGRPTPDRGCPRCRGSAPTTGCRGACRPSTGVSSSMARSRRGWARATTTPTRSR